MQRLSITSCKPELGLSASLVVRLIGLLLVFASQKMFHNEDYKATNFSQGLQEKVFSQEVRLLACS